MAKSMMDALIDIEVAVIDIGLVDGVNVSDNLKIDLWGRLTSNLRDHAIQAKKGDNSLGWQDFLHLLPDHEIEELANILNDWASDRRNKVVELFKLAQKAELLPDSRRFDVFKGWDSYSESQQEKAFVAMDAQVEGDDSVSFLKWLKQMNHSELTGLHEQIRCSLMEKVGEEMATLPSTA